MFKINNGIFLNQISKEMTNSLCSLWIKITYFASRINTIFSHYIITSLLFNYYYSWKTIVITKLFCATLHPKVAHQITFISWPLMEGTKCSNGKKGVFNPSKLKAAHIISVNFWATRTICKYHPFKKSMSIALETETKLDGQKLEQ